MIKIDKNHPKFTEHEKNVLRNIIDYAKTPDNVIAELMGISPQAVFKIRVKLEKLGVIKGYVPVIDFKKLGINVMVILAMRLNPEVWSKYSDDAISERIRHNPYVIAAYRVADVHASHILIMGFKDTEQKENYLTILQTKYATDIKIMDVYTFSVDKIILQNPINLLNEILDKKDVSNYDFFQNGSKQHNTKD